MEDRDEMDAAADGSLKVQRACDSCRLRKIRCDRTIPCSNCRASKLSCQTTAPTQKVQRQRIHISDEYERKIDRIEDRLAGIENVLESLAAKLGNLDIKSETSEPSTTQSKSSRIGRSPNSSAEVNAPSPAPFEGETTLNTQSTFARDYLERTVVNTSIGQNPQVKAALTSLQSMVKRQNQNVTSKTDAPLFVHKAASDVNISQLERPPWEAASDVLDKATTYPTMCFAVVFPFLKLSGFKEIFKETWDTPQDAPVGRRILVYGILYNIFTEFGSYPLLGPRNEKYREYGLQSRVQMETAMSELDMFLPASYENILALLLAASYAVEMCKPSLCWTMTSTAANLCQHLGYHRIDTMKDDTMEERASKIRVFWFIYVMDKTLSLRLGRASSIQDWDMSLPFPAVGESCDPLFASAKGSEIQLYWIKVAQIQGQTYERLFSPAAFMKSEQERAQTAAELVNALNRAWSERGEIKLTFLGSFGDVGDLFYHADVVMHYSIMSLIQRAVIPDNVTFNQDCLESARAALVSHQRCSKKYNIRGNEDLWAGYLHWSVLQAPFTPFIVIFCNAITHCDPSDLTSLSEFVISLESCRTISDGADKLYKMCHMFLQVAKLYAEAKNKEIEAQNEHTNQNGFYVPASSEQNLDLSAMTQFDPYLSALGLVPNSAWPMAGFVGMDGSAEGASAAGGEALQAAFDHTGGQNTVQDWFSGSRYIMGLMEEDINMPDLNF
ncbi:fungal-specific transcription factor domain-containing protein [Lindgomyces ingoldianus]|uniref:Fungal-specific transcription factor domain-containing protein n=1 Tax=Lindgomyces ingoldianus TaxID=673940 RepID=A0ACB6R391_9PLEO|nr:fungal-specific transcription factor domain-containing protein [Lindgomyces ingoldianus]KAF2472790.1 fungal-specific transcription factor domain-containing protein [Lindgomyces ingoldianus]